MSHDIRAMKLSILCRVFNKCKVMFSVQFNYTGVSASCILPSIGLPPSFPLIKAPNKSKGVPDDISNPWASITREMSAKLSSSAVLAETSWPTTGKTSAVAHDNHNTAAVVQTTSRLDVIVTEEFLNYIDF